MSTTNGGAAFPYDRSLLSGQPQTGMSLRDWFAGQALAGYVAGAAGDQVSMEAAMVIAEENGSTIHDVFAKSAYHTADAMLKAREA